jgi:uncharacterized protein (TIGR03083 family)
VKRETRRFVEVAARSPLAAYVPTYPAFTVETLAAHVGTGLRIFRTILTGGTYNEGERVVAPPGAAVISWVEDGLEPLLLALKETPPDRPVRFPHEAGELPARVVAGFLGVEVGIHRWDLESILGDHAPLPADLAIGAIDKVFDSFAPRLAGKGVSPIGGTITFRSTDSDVGWAAAVDDGRLITGRVDSDVGRGDTTVRATVEDLALIIWKRWPPFRPGVEVSGSQDILKRFLAVDYIPDPRTTAAR